MLLYYGYYVHILSDPWVFNCGTILKQRQAAQCVGRVIRSKADYGMMLFADKRFVKIHPVISFLAMWKFIGLGIDTHIATPVNIKQPSDSAV